MFSTQYDGDWVQDQVWEIVAQEAIEAAVRFIDAYEYEIKWDRDGQSLYYYDVQVFIWAVEKWVMENDNA